MTNIRGDDLIAIGLTPGPVFGVALNALPKAVKRLGREQALAQLAATIADPAAHTSHAYFAAVAQRLIAVDEKAAVQFAERDEPAPYASWCVDAEPGALAQMRNAMRLPVAVVGALMPDAHLGYGLPIGGVLATENAVIPYAVGVDIACRMKLSVFDIPADQHRAACATGSSTRLRARDAASASGARFTQAAASTRCWRGLDGHAGHERRCDKARGAARHAAASGNHFVEFGMLTLEQAGPRPRRRASTSRCSRHSGSRGTGATVARPLLASSRWTCTPSCRRSCGASPGSISTRGRPGVLGRDEPDGRLRRRQPRADPPAASPRRSARACSRASRTTTTSPGRKRTAAAS